MDAHSLTSLISEVLSLVGLALGVILYLAGAFVRGIKGRWIAADGVIAASGTGTVIRWFDQDGDVHECPATTHETHQLPPGRDVPLWFNSRTPTHCRTHAPEAEGRGLRLTGLILLGTGLAAAILGFVLMFV
ncbi:sortase [Cryobacterium algoritolerans]|uniref:Sortase n=1 Tax=Cryobacterium algoritolerans TaxID=1259184 RepID=A0A4R8WIM9_9MICO|nr:DUF3592 domain-containing protein [Cryobacterium algoritolerans]TFC09675.1 sortase [Cryobacterium algoritolerans]